MEGGLHAGDMVKQDLQEVGRGGIMSLLEGEMLLLCKPIWSCYGWNKKKFNS